MKKLKETMKRIATLGLTAVLLTNSFPAVAFADETDGTEPAVVIDAEDMEGSEEIGEGVTAVDVSDDEDDGEKMDSNEERQEYPVFDQSKSIDGVKVSVTADEGVFPEGATLSVSKALSEAEAAAESAVEDVRSDEKNVAASYTFDIKVLDKDGNEIQPSDSNKVKISFTLSKVADSNLSTDIYHIKEGAEALSVSESGSTATAETDGFSLYTVEFTYTDKQYVLPGDSEVELSAILETVGLSGDVSAVSVSDETLFSAARNDSGAWIVTAHQAFDTEEWMKVTINDVVYEITVTDDEDTITTWAELQTALNAGGLITLTQDLSATDSDSFLNILDGVNVTLDLAGHTIDRGLYKSDGSVNTTKENGLVLKVYGTLTLNDSGSGGKLTGGNNQYKKDSSPDGGCIYVGSSGNLIMNGGEITYNKGGEKTAGGGVFVEGSMTMNGGTISHNTAKGNGGGIYVSESKTFTMTDGTIAYNTSEKRGGGIESYRQGTITMSGGTIAHNTAQQGGGIDSRNSGIINISGGTIAHNTAQQGGGIDSRDSGIINMSGGTIEYNSATGTSSSDLGGGGICIRGDSSALLLTITGGTIRENTSDKAGGGITVYSASAKITNATIANNTTKGFGGAIAIIGDIWSQKYCLINGNTTITGNSSISYGGAISADGHVRISDTAQITNNKTARDSSGAVDLDSTSNLNVAGSVQITGNTITEGGRAANVKLDTGNIINGVTDGNTTTYLSSDASIGVAKGDPLAQDVNFLSADTTNNPETILGYFSSDGGYLIKYDSGALKLSAYTVSIQDGVPLSASQSRARSGDTITLTRSAGYDVSNVTYSDGSQSYPISESDGVYTFTMPACDVTVTAEYTREKRPITISSSTNGNIVSDKSNAYYGETVTLTITPDTGFVLKSLIVAADGSNVSVNGLTPESSWDSTWYNNTSVTISMPDAAVTVSAEFEAKSSLYVKIPKSGSKSFTIPSGFETFMVYDNSGKDGHYIGLDNGTLVLTAPEGYAMHVTGYVKVFGYSQLEDYLDIHDGDTTGATNLGQFWCNKGGDNPENIPVDVTSSSNQILLHFVTNGSGYLYNGGGVYLTVTLVKLHTVSFENGGGTGTMDSKQVVEDNEYTLPECSFNAPADKKFKEWSVKIGDAAVVTKAAGDTITVMADTTVTAVWEDKTAITPSVSIEGWTYGDAANSPTTTGNTGNGTEKIEYKIKGAADTTYSETGPTDSGEYTVRVTIAETAQYQSGTATANFTISRKSVIITGLSVSNKEYDGTTAATITGTAEISGKVGSDDVTVSAGNAAFDNANVGESKTVTFSGYSLAGTAAGNYTLSAQPASVTADITAKSIAGAEVTLSAEQFEYNGSERSVSVTSVKLADTTLTTDDYEVSGILSGTDKGTYTVTVTGKGNYTGSETATWEITDKLMTVSAEDVTVTYDGQAHGIIVSVSDPASGYTIKYGNTEGAYNLDTSPTITNVSDGPKTVYFRITADNYQTYTGSATITINPKMVNSPTIVLSETSYGYNGTAKEPDVTVKDGNTEISSDEYTVSYSDNTNAGTATVTITDKTGGNYTVNGNTTFAITKATINPIVTISGWTYGSTASAPTVGGNTGSGTVTIEYKLKTANDSAYSAAVPTDAGEYTVRATIAESTNYLGGTATADFTIAKADGETTKPAKPALKLKTDTTIEVQTVAGYEYSRNDGTSWQDSGKFTGLTADTGYNIVTRRKETTNVKAGTKSDALTVKTNKKAGQTTEVIGTISGGTGAIKVETVFEEDVPKSTVTGLTADLAESLLTDEEKIGVQGGQTLTVALDMKNIDSTVQADDKTKSEAKAEEVGGNSAKVGLYLDISLSKQIGDGDATQVHKTGGKKVHMVLTVPESLRNTNSSITRTFFIIRIHEGVAAKIAESTSTDIPFDSDLFSTYALAYSDKSNGGSGSSSGSESTGGNSGGTGGGSGSAGGAGGGGASGGSGSTDKPADADKPSETEKPADTDKPAADVDVTKDPSEGKTPAGKEETSTVTAADGSTTETSKVTNTDGSTTEKEKVTSTDGTISDKTTVTEKDGTVKTQETTESADGSKVETASEVKPNGDFETKTVTTDKDGKTQEVSESKITDDSGVVTETKDTVKPNGTSTEKTKVTQPDGDFKSETVQKNATGEVTKTVTETKSTNDKTGNVTFKTETVKASGASESSKVVSDSKGNLTKVSITETTAGGKKATVDLKADKSGNVTVSNIDSTKSTVSIPDAVVDADGKSHEVTTIKAGALGKESKVKSLVVGKNVERFEANALKNSSVKNLELSSVPKFGKNSLKTKGKLTIVVHSQSDKKAVEKQLKNAGAPNAKVKVVKTKK